MKFTRPVISFSLCILFCGLLQPFRAYAHENTVVHPAITRSAVQSSAGLNSFLANYFETSPSLALYQPKLSLDPAISESLELSPIEWVARGSIQEDYPDVRGKNHFYDPTKNPAIGLTDRLDGWGQPSFKWASESYQDLIRQRSYSWPEARAYMLNSLTNSSLAERHKQAAEMLLYLGHVMHLNEDLTSPMHVRNDNHMAYKSISPFGPNYTETYGAEHYLENPQWFNPQPHGWAWWQSVASFTKLEDFWNRDFLRIQLASALNDDANSVPGKKLGLAEFSNGNFICEDALYREFFNVGDKHYFSFPSLDHSTDYRSRLHLAANVGTSYLKNGTPIQRIRISKVNDGITVTNHSMLNYLGIQGSGRRSSVSAIAKVSTTVNDPSVLQEYHEKLIPKAVEYSGGLLDYFFRGKINACIVSGSDTNTLGLLIQNKSLTNLYGGKFELYSENAAGVRTLVMTTNLFDLLGEGISLDDNASVTMDFTPPTNQPAAYVAVYQGTIGATNSIPLDPVDANIAIAVKRIISPQYPDADDTTPACLSYENPADMGQVTVSAASESTTNWVSFGNIGPGEYEINYVSGAYGFAPISYWTVDGSLGTVALYNRESEMNDGAENVVTRITGRFDGADLLDDSWTLEEVESITSAMNPESLITQIATGPIALKLGPGIVHFGDAGEVTYQLQRVASLYTQPNRVRIRNYATEVKPQLSICTNYLNMAAGSEWDGTFNARYLNGINNASWKPDSTHNWIINGTQSDYITTEFASIFLPGIGSVPGWKVSVWGVSGSQYKLVWEGYKMTGGTPVGIYYKSVNEQMCADNLCCLYIESY